MAKLLWGKVFYQDQFAGILQQEPGDIYAFEYDSSYLEAQHPAISHSFPLSQPRHVCMNGLHPFFDNLVAEGWLAQAQTRVLGERQVSRFELLLAFGYDCAGAVSVLDPEPAGLSELLLDTANAKEMALLTSRASLSGVQPKLAVVERKGHYYPVTQEELSTHIAKFPSRDHSDLTVNEYLTTQAFKALLPEDQVVNLSLAAVESISGSALIIERFDRTPEGQRVHFEEFNQLLQKPSTAKYQGAYEDMAHFLKNTSGCLPTESYRLFARIATGLLLGNTDMHFKNFAMFHTDSGLRLTPSYDQVAAAVYPYKTIALALGQAKDVVLAKLKAKALVRLAEAFGLSGLAHKMLLDQLEANLPKATAVIQNNKCGHDKLKSHIIQLMEERWRGAFSLIGKHL
ncbi:MAG: HipA domain-containing protein [Coxiellaceae bacterium]|nr:HipA domain-containing protein [Coxiellaceae bacterium]